MTAPRAARAREPWEDDPAHQALQQWIYAWRQQHPDARLPRRPFAEHLGREAAEQMNQGMGRVDLQRLFWQLGTEGECLCGHRHDQPLPATDPQEAA